MGKKEPKTPIRKGTSGDRTCSSIQRRAELCSGASLVEGSSVSPFLTPTTTSLHWETELFVSLPEFDRKHLDSRDRVCTFEWEDSVSCSLKSTRSPKTAYKVVGLSSSSMKLVFKLSQSDQNLTAVLYP